MVRWSAEQASTPTSSPASSSTATSPERPPLVVLGRYPAGITSGYRPRTESGSAQRVVALAEGALDALVAGHHPRVQHPLELSGVAAQRAAVVADEVGAGARDARLGVRVPLVVRAGEPGGRPVGIDDVVHDADHVRTWRVAVVEQHLGPGGVEDGVDVGELHVVGA